MIKMTTPNKKLLRAENNGIQKWKPIEIPHWFFNTNQVELWPFHQDGENTKDWITVKHGVFVVVNGDIVATVIGKASVFPTIKVDW